MTDGLSDLIHDLMHGLHFHLQILEGRAVELVEHLDTETEGHRLRQSITEVNAEIAAGRVRPYVSEARELQDCVRNLLSRIKTLEWALQEQNRKVCSGRSLVTEAVNTFRSGGPYLSKRLHCEPMHDAEIEVFPNQIKIAILNLLENAILHSKGSTVNVTANCDAEKGIFVIQVLSFGRWISPQEMANLFEDPFKDIASGHGARGNGRGLFMARRFAVNQGGTCDATSTFVDGSGFQNCFTISLPLGSRRDASPRRTIYWIDDDADFKLPVMEQALRKLHYAIVVLTTIEEAVSAIGDIVNKADVVVLDLKFQGDHVGTYSGLKLLREIRSVEDRQRQLSGTKPEFDSIKRVPVVIYSKVVRTEPPDELALILEELDAALYVHSLDSPSDLRDAILQAIGHQASDSERTAT